MRSRVTSIARTESRVILTFNYELNVSQDSRTYANSRITYFRSGISVISAILADNAHRLSPEYEMSDTINASEITAQVGCTRSIVKQQLTLVDSRATSRTQIIQDAIISTTGYIGTMPLVGGAATVTR